MMAQKRNWGRKILVAVAVFIAFNFLIAMPVMTVIVYETIFNKRYEPASWTRFEVSDFEGLSVEECFFPSNEGQSLAGYHYSGGVNNPLGVVVLAHGLGCGGQNSMMPFADLFTDSGYLVFSYDATGNDRSDGEDVNGLPQGVADLDYALRYVKDCPRYKGLPIFLLGHSWGGYSVGAVLNLHSDVAGAVLISGADTSLGLMVEDSKKIVGPLVYPEIPYLALYERLKFGEYSGYSVLDGFAACDAKIVVVHSTDDATVPVTIGYDQFYEEYAEDPRFTFVSFDDRGHDRPYCSPAAFERTERLNEAYLEFVDEQGLEHGARTKEIFFEQYEDWVLCFELDPDLCALILQTFGQCIGAEG